MFILLPGDPWPGAWSEGDGEEEADAVHDRSDESTCRSGGRARRFHGVGGFKRSSFSKQMPI